MFKSRFVLPFLAALLGLVFAAGAQAQATRTWVSGVGDDVNPCSRTAPCKTFAGAISKTAAGGEISVLDPGGFGTLTITKSITINGEGTLASILSSSINGVVVSAGAGDVVTLRNLSINGAGTTLGTNGVRFLSGKALHIERVQIHNFSQNGVDFEPSGTASLFITDTMITNTQVGNSSLSQAGVLVKPGVSGSAAVVIKNSRIEENRIGLRIEDRSKVTVEGSSVSRNAQFGGWVVTAGTPGSLFIKNNVFSSNGPTTVLATGTALRAEGANAVIRMSNNVVTGSQLGLSPLLSGSILSYGENQVSGNDSDGSPSGFITDI
jgi:hypothetical protein